MSISLPPNDIDQSLNFMTTISHINFNQPLQWNHLEDDFIQRYEAHLSSLNANQDIFPVAESLEYEQFNPTKTHHIPNIQMFRFKDIFFDFLQGQNHQVSYLGHQSQNLAIQTEIIKQIVSILFKIAQQQKVVYPHLLTHLKQQFYKPNIFDSQILNESTKQKYSVLIDIFFNEAHETSKFQDFIRVNPDFQDICLIVFRKIVIENHKWSQSQGLQHLNPFKVQAFEIIQNLCSKFLIEINHFGYDEPGIEVIALANEQRFLFLSEQGHFFLLTLEKFQFLNVRRKSSHNISIHEKNEKSLRKSSQNKSLKKNSWSQLDESAHFKTGQPSKDYLVLNIIDSDETSNYESSILKSQSKVNQLSDQSTPKFKHSSIAHLRKKSHKDSFGGVDFDNMVYKDLANPKRYADQKAHRQKDNAKNHALQAQIYNKKVLSERFETNELESLTYVEDEESQIEFVPHFQMNDGNQKGKTVSVFGNNPTSPAYSNNTYTSFTQYANKFQAEENKSKMIQRMKGSNIEKSAQHFAHEEEQLPEMIPQFKHQNSLQSPGRTQRTHSPGSRVLASSEIIEFTGSFFKQQIFKNDQYQRQQNLDFLVIPSMNSKFNTVSQKDQNGNFSLFASPHKDVFMSFSKNDKQKFIIPDNQQIEVIQQKQGQKAQRGTRDTIQVELKQKQDTINNVRTRKYSYRTQRQQRQKFRSKMKNENQNQVSQTMNSFISEHTPSSFAKKPRYKKYHEVNTSQSIIFNQYDSASQINMNNSHTFTSHNNQKDLIKLQRKHSSNIPVYKATEPQQNVNRPRNQQVHFNSKNIQKRFEQNSVRFSQVFQNNEEEIFYIQQKDQSRQSFGNRKQRKVTDFYERPLTNLVKGGNRTSQIIENGTATNKNNALENRFEGHLEVLNDHSNVLINSGGGKNYSVISNISYDEEKRIEDLIELQNQHGIIRKQLAPENNGYGNFTDQQIELGNIQAIERLLLKKKQQKLRLSSQQSVISINSKSNSLSQPKDWVKKEVFYFFEQSPLSPLRPPQKHVIINPDKPTNRVVRQETLKSHSKNRELPSSSTSLHNYSTKPIRQENPEFQGDRQKSVSNKSLGDRKYSVKQIIKPVSEMNLNNSFVEGPLIQKLNSSPFMSHQGQNLISIRENRGVVNKDFDKLSVYTQHSPTSIIRVSPPKRQQTMIPVVIPAPKSLKISAQNLKTYPSQPIIRFTLGNNPLLTNPPPHAHPLNLKPIPSQQTLKTYRIN